MYFEGRKYKEIDLGAFFGKVNLNLQLEKFKVQVSKKIVLVRESVSGLQAQANGVRTFYQFLIKIKINTKKFVWTHLVGHR